MNSDRFLSTILLELSNFDIDLRGVQGRHTYRLLLLGENVRFITLTVVSNIKINSPCVYFTKFYRTRNQEFNFCGLSQPNGTNIHSDPLPFAFCGTWSYY